MTVGEGNFLQPKKVLGVKDWEGAKPPKAVLWELPKISWELEGVLGMG